MLADLHFALRYRPSPIWVLSGHSHAALRERTVRPCITLAGRIIWQAKQKWGCVKIGTPSFNISQSPNFHKHGLCYSIIFLYLYGKNL